MEEFGNIKRNMMSIEQKFWKDLDWQLLDLAMMRF